MKKYFLLFALLFSWQYVTATEHQFTGEITDLAETGRGGEVWLRLTQAEGAQSLDFSLADDNALQLKIGQQLTVDYKIVTEPLMIGLRLTSEPVSTRFSADTPQRLLEQPQYTLVGDYISGQLGDGGMYLQLRDRHQVVHELVGLFEVDADNKAKYVGKEIEVTYIKEQKTEILHYQIQSTELSGCMDNAETQMQINQCTYEDYAQADAELNQVYRKILVVYSEDSAFLEKLKIAQRAWITFRDAHLEALYPEQDKRFAYGSMYPSCSNHDLTVLTRQRIIQLQQWLTGVSEGNACTKSIRIMESSTE